MNKIRKISKCTATRLLLREWGTYRVSGIKDFSYYYNVAMLERLVSKIKISVKP